MGKTILTPKQLDFLEFVQKEPFLIKNFYWTGGTALSEFYLKHRLSEDIDLFIEKKEVDPKLTDAFLKKISFHLKVSKIKRSQFLGLVSYKLIYKDSKELKKDFSLQKLILDAKAKFDWDIDRVTLVSQFLKVKELKEAEFPKVLVQFDRSKMMEFFLNLAKSLEKDI